MPDVVVVKEVEEDAVSVVFSRLCWGFLGVNQDNSPLTPALAGPGPDPGCPVPGRKAPLTRKWPWSPSPPLPPKLFLTL